MSVKITSKIVAIAKTAITQNAILPFFDHSASKVAVTKTLPQSQAIKIIPVNQLHAPQMDNKPAVRYTLFFPSTQIEELKRAVG